MKVQAFDSSKRLRLNDTTSTQTQGQASSAAYQVPFPAISNQNQDSTSALDKTTEDKPWWQKPVTLILGGLAIIGGAVALLMKSKNGDKTQKKQRSHGNTPIDTVSNSDQAKQSEEPKPIDYSKIDFKQWTQAFQINLDSLSSKLWETGLKDYPKIDSKLLKTILFYCSINRGSEEGIISILRQDINICNDKDFAEFRLKLLKNLIESEYLGKLEETIIEKLSSESELILGINSEKMPGILDICKKFVKEEEVQKAIEEQKTDIEDGLSSVEKLLRFNLNSCIASFNNKLESIEPLQTVKSEIKSILIKEIIKDLQTRPLNQSNEIRNKNLDEIREYVEAKSITWSPINHYLYKNFLDFVINKGKDFSEKLESLGLNTEKVSRLIELDCILSCNEKFNYSLSNDRKSFYLDLQDDDFPAFEKVEKLTENDLRLLYEFQHLKNELKVPLKDAPRFFIERKFWDKENDSQNDGLLSLISSSDKLGLEETTIRDFIFEIDL